MSFFKTEKEFEHQIYNYILAHRFNPINGRPVVGICKQPSLGCYGIADLITLEKHGEKDVLNVIELKNVPFQAGMIFQVGRYLAAVKMASNYKKLNCNIFNFEDDREILKMYENAEVIGSLVCTECDDITQGVSLVCSMLSVSVFSSSMELLSICFEQMTSASDYDLSQIQAIQSSISALSNPIDDAPF
jgi:hypothetical protein